MFWCCDEKKKGTNTDSIPKLSQALSGDMIYAISFNLHEVEIEKKTIIYPESHIADKGTMTQNQFVLTSEHIM